MQSKLTNLIKNNDKGTYILLIRRMQSINKLLYFYTKKIELKMLIIIGYL